MPLKPKMTLRLFKNSDGNIIYHNPPTNILLMVFSLTQIINIMTKRKRSRAVAKIKGLISICWEKSFNRSCQNTLFLCILFIYWPNYHVSQMNFIFEYFTICIILKSVWVIVNYSLTSLLYTFLLFLKFNEDFCKCVFKKNIYVEYSGCGQRRTLFQWLLGKNENFWRKWWTPNL